ncbi:hypothetical protein V9K67_02855 [Paraflavisolibacter sp. H34]|uniref:hypothetical protein n=1 Tax=Huijunlia imazamoxiresistens TaxID=3127457 RepID=UPI003015D96B
MKKFFAVFAVAAALTACGGNSEGTSAPDTTTTVTNSAVDSNVVAPAVNDTAAQGGTIQDTSTTVIDTPAHH